MRFKKCAIYTRVSTDNQAEKEYNSCRTQEDKIKSYINSQNNWEIFDIYSDEGYTGANLDRPAFKRLMRDIYKIDVILFYKLDRLTRSPKDFYHLVELFEKHNVDFISITEKYDTSTPSGRLLMNVILTVAQFERELTSERTKHKMVERARQGFWNGGTTPFGYRVIDKKLKIEPQEAFVVAELFRAYLKTKSLRKTYHALNILGYDFTLQRIYKILRNPVYTGKIKYDNQIYDGVHEPIITIDDFDIATKLHKPSNKKHRSYRKYALVGIIHCKECGLAMTPTFVNKNGGRRLVRYFYYRCITTLKKEWKLCRTHQVNADKLEKYILKQLLRLCNDDIYLEILVKHHQNELSIKTNQLIELPESQIRNLQNSVKFSISAIAEIMEQPNSDSKNRSLKGWIKKINYSPEQIEIELHLSDATDDKRAGEGLASVRAEDRHIEPGNRERAGGVFGGVVNNKYPNSIDDKTGGCPKLPVKNSYMIIENEIHKDKRLIKSV